jgi:hypothetical protein
VETIPKFSQSEWWRHCPGLQNPADLASRGAPSPTLVTLTLWWNGQIWLKGEETEWPDSPNDQIPQIIQTEMESEARSTTVSTTAAIAIPTTSVDWNLEKISTWNRLLRRTARVSRFLSRSQGKLRPPGPERMESIKANGKVIRITRLFREELDEAEITIYSSNESDILKAFESLQLDNTIQPKEKVAALFPIWDARDRLIRIHGRVSLALRDRNIDPPILLTASHIVITFLITDKHESLLHAGAKVTLSELKEKFWIVKGRQQVKKILFTCVECKKLTLSPFQEIAAPLLLNRLKHAQSFHVTGVDFAGPLLYKPAQRRKKREAPPRVQDPTPADDPNEEQIEEPLTEGDAPIEAPIVGEEDSIEEDVEIQDILTTTTKSKKTNHLKCYVCLFICAVTRAIHLEILPDMTARSFLLAFRKFAARRGFYGQFLQAKG